MSFRGAPIDDLIDETESEPTQIAEIPKALIESLVEGAGSKERPVRKPQVTKAPGGKAAGVRNRGAVWP